MPPSRCSGRYGGDLAGAAGGVDAELSADQVGGGLGHGPQGGGLAAGDGDEAFHPVRGGVVEALEGARQLATAAAAAGRADQRPGRRPGGPLGGRGHRRDQLGPLPVHRLDVLLGHLEVVGVGHSPGAGPDDRQAPLGHHDVAVAGRVQAVDDQIAQPADERQQHPGGWLDGHGRAGHGGQALAPGAGGVDDQVGRQFGVAAGHMVVGDHSGDPPTGGHQPGHFGKGLQPGAAQPCGGEEPQRQPHRVHARVRHQHRRPQRRVQPGLQG
jgi:hypothetical protein